MNLRLPTRFVILDKAIATLGSVAAEVYPDFNVFEVARPYAKQLIGAVLGAAASRSDRRASYGTSQRLRSRCRGRCTTC